MTASTAFIYSGEGVVGLKDFYHIEIERNIRPYRMPRVKAKSFLAL